MPYSRRNKHDHSINSKSGKRNCGCKDHPSEGQGVNCLPAALQQPVPVKNVRTKKDAVEK